MNEHHGDSQDTGKGLCEPSGGEGFLWRPWPCDSCASEDKTAIGHLFRGIKTDPELFSGNLEEVIKRQAELLVCWVEQCPHTSWVILENKFLTQGSEHAVYWGEQNSHVVKVTLPWSYGDYYYLLSERVHQEKCTPLQYLVRQHLWDKMFRAAPVPKGITKEGRILSHQIFVSGDLPTQAGVDVFLEESGLEPVKASCFLWRKIYPEFQIWIGDTRDENFVATDSGIVPVDIRLWFTPPS